MRVLITGSSGFIGRNISTLKNEKIDFYGIDRVASELLETDKNFVGDITDFSFIKDVFEQVKPDIVIHLAAIVHKNNADTSEQNYDLINFESSKHIFDLCKQYEAKIIFSSTIEVFSEQLSEYDEKSTCEPKSFYGKSKLKAEQYLKQMNYDNYVVLRFSPVYGKDFTLNVDKRVFLIKNKLAYYFKNGNYGFDFISILNIVGFIEFLLFHSTEEKVFILSDVNKISVKEIIDLHKKYNNLKMVWKLPYSICYGLLFVLEKIQETLLRRDAYLSRRNLLKLFANKTYCSKLAQKYYQFQYNYEQTVYGEDVL